MHNFRARHRPVMPLPARLQVEPTFLCNFKCRHCPHSEQQPHRPGASLHMDLGLFKRIVDGLPSLREIKLQGLGEPLLCPDLCAMMEYGHGKGIAFNIISNGTLVAEVLPALIPHLRRFVISFDTFDQAWADRNKTGFRIERAMQSVRQMVQIKRLRNPGCTVGITSVVSHENVAEVPEIMRFARDAGVDYAGFVAIENWKVPGEPTHAESAGNVAAARKVVSMDRIKALYDQGGYRFQLGLQDFSLRKSNCYWMYESAYITHDGYVTPCCVRPNREVFSFGNVKNTGFPEIWNSKAAQEFRKTHLQKTPNEICDGCPL